MLMAVLQMRKLRLRQNQPAGEAHATRLDSHLGLPDSRALGSLTGPFGGEPEGSVPRPEPGG